MSTITPRRLRPGEFIDALTAMLRRALARWAFGRPATVQVVGPSGRGAVFGKTVGEAARPFQHGAWPPRHPAEMAMLARQQHRSHRVDRVESAAADLSEALASSALGARAWPR